MDILEKIVAHKKLELARSKAITAEALLEKSPFFARKTVSLREFLLDDRKTGIIAEFKRQSPSKGIINGQAGVFQVTKAYTAFGASGLSILTDNHFFGGHQDDIIKARGHEIPILRKDFIIDPYQVREAKSIGADVVLLIAACLSPMEVRSLAALAKSLQLEVLLEIHHQGELDHICDEIDLVGVNNRDLRTFAVDIRRSESLSPLIPAGKIKITESGISSVDTIATLKRSGFQGFLIGENFMKEPDPAIAFASFVNQLKKGPHESKSLRHDSTRSSEKTG